MSEENKSTQPEGKPADLGTDSTLAFYQAIDWYEKNRSMVYMGLVVIAVIFLVIYGMQSLSEAKEVKASQALALVMDKISSADGDESKMPTGDDFMAIVNEHSGTKAAARALMTAGSAYFEDDKFKEALAAFDQVLTQFPDESQVVIENAKYGKARCLESQNELDKALDIYKSLENAYQPSLADAAKFAAGRILQSKGDLKGAFQIFDQLSLGTGFSYQTRQASVLKQDLLKLDPSLKPATVSTNAPATITN